MKMKKKIQPKMKHVNFCSMMFQWKKYMKIIPICNYKIEKLLINKNKNEMNFYKLHAQKIKWKIHCINEF